MDTADPMKPFPTSVRLYRLHLQAMRIRDTTLPHGQMTNPNRSLQALPCTPENDHWAANALIVLTGGKPPHA